jgi:chromosome segregation ATPase
MDTLRTAETELKTAQDALTVLTDELPTYHALLTENEADVQKLKTEKASLDAQAQAKGRVNVAREMLDQHLSDIQNARAEVARLEIAVKRELTLQRMGDKARAVTKQRRALETAVHEGSAALGKTLTDMHAALTVLQEHRAEFAALGTELAPEFNSREPFGDSIQGNAKRAVCEQLTRELEGRGVTLTDALNSCYGPRTPVDREGRTLPTPEHSELLWQVFAEAVAKHNRATYYQVHLPVRAEPVPLGITDALPDPKYSL